MTWKRFQFLVAEVERILARYEKMTHEEFDAAMSPATIAELKVVNGYCKELHGLKTAVLDGWTVYVALNAIQVGELRSDDYVLVKREVKAADLMPEGDTLVEVIEGFNSAPIPSEKNDYAQQIMAYFYATGSSGFIYEDSVFLPTLGNSFGVWSFRRAEEILEGA